MSRDALAEIRFAVDDYAPPLMPSAVIYYVEQQFISQCFYADRISAGVAANSSALFDVSLRHAATLTLTARHALEV